MNLLTPKSVIHLKQGNAIMVEDYLYIHSLSYPITVLGPGKRIALWFEGCSLNCPGCMAASMKTRHQHNRMTVNEIFRKIEQAAEGLDGITISGGEPFEQADALYEMVKLIRSETHLDIMVYSGYTIEELSEYSESSRQILGLIDILIDGRFEEWNSNKKMWRGSDNQRMHLLSERAQKYKCFENARYGVKRTLSFELDKSNELKIIGIPERGFIRQFEDALLTKGMSIAGRNTNGND